jgi:hypothetical protein
MIVAIENTSRIVICEECKKLFSIPRGKFQRSLKRFPLYLCSDQCDINHWKKVRENLKF